MENFDDIRDSASPALDASQLSELRPYVVNLTQGQFSTDGCYTTTASDVDAIFDHYLPRFIAARGGDPVPVAIWAHGGLVNEDQGLQIAHGQVKWWLDNGVYPLHFVWETGTLDALKQILLPVSRGRDLADETTDPVIEFAARPLGSKLWLAMKQSAKLASEDGGGALYTARKLAQFASANPSLALHAIGHSAGSIFHSHFIPAVLRAGVPQFASLSLLAPAITVENFKKTLAPLVGNGIADIVVFAMRRELERADNCLRIYRKSLLYLVARALETTRDTPLLGLEDSLRLDPAMIEFFGLATPAEHAGVVWSLSPDDAPAGKHSSSKSHGGFDNNQETMNSVAYRVLGAPATQPFPAALEAQGRDLWVDAGTTPTASPAPRPKDTAPFPQQQPGSRKLALCVGIDAYPTPRDQLGGAVNDARHWADVLGDMKFDVTVLTDGDATRQAIIDSLSGLLSGAPAGSVVVFQYAGHGTEVPDSYLAGRDGRDEDDSNDEALCPVDFREVGVLLDDDLYRLVSEYLPDQVNLTGFYDCCHSGSGFRGFDPRIAVPDTLRARSVPFEPAMFGPGERGGPHAVSRRLPAEDPTGALQRVPRRRSGVRKRGARSLHDARAAHRDDTRPDQQSLRERGDRGVQRRHTPAPWDADVRAGDGHAALPRPIDLVLSRKT